MSPAIAEPPMPRTTVSRAFACSLGRVNSAARCHASSHCSGSASMRVSSPCGSNRFTVARSSSAVSVPMSLLRLPGELLRRLVQVFHRIDRLPVGARAKAVQPALRGEAGQELVLVVAHVRQPGEELRLEHVDAGAQPVREQRLLAKAHDLLAALLDDAVGAAE